MGLNKKITFLSTCALMMLIIISLLKLTNRTITANTNGVRKYMERNYGKIEQITHEKIMTKTDNVNSKQEAEDDDGNGDKTGEDEQLKYDFGSPVLMNKMPKTYKVTQVKSDDLADIITDFLKEQSTETGTLKLTADEELLKFFRYLDEKDIVIDYEGQKSKRNRLMILTSYHSGSTFTGNLFNAHPDVFYMFEPLHFIQQEGSWSKPRVRQNETNHYLNMMLNCEYRKTFEASIKFYPNGESGRRGWFSKCFKDKIPNMAYSDDTLETVLKQLESHCLYNFSSTVIKAIRADSIATIVPLIASGVKILYLIRDPRGLANSRFKKQLETSEEKLLNHMEMECAKNHRNIEFLKKAKEIKILNKLLLKYFRVIRYEDIAYSTMERSQDIYSFADLKLTEYVRAQIIAASSTNKTLGLNDGVAESDRSKAISTKWRLSLPYNIIRKLEDQCKLTVDELGFKILKSEYQYKNETIDLISDINNIPYIFK